MSPFSWPVLVPSLVLCSPVLFDAFRGAMDWSDALERFLLVLTASWIAVSVVHSLAFPESGVVHAPPASGAEPEPEVVLDGDISGV